MTQTFEDLTIRVLSIDDARRDVPARPAGTAVSAPADARNMIPDTARPQVARWKPHYRVRAESSQGERAATFDFPYTDEEAGRLIGSGPFLDEETIEDFGKRLFKAAFSGDVGTLFEMTNQAAKRWR